MFLSENSKSNPAILLSDDNGVGMFRFDSFKKSPKPLICLGPTIPMFGFFFRLLIANSKEFSETIVSGFNIHIYFPLALFTPMLTPLEKPKFFLFLIKTTSGNNNRI